tara:strand:- start:1440 stop:1652 length:213 start_codon:yes stop_codon:yes gene_type:complete
MYRAVCARLGLDPDARGTLTNVVNEGRRLGLCHHSNLSKWASGQAHPSRRKLRQFEEAFGFRLVTTWEVA